MAVPICLFTVLLMIMAVLALDVGRLIMLRIQMQNAADAAALAAAVQLTGANGSRTLAESVARNATQQVTRLLEPGTKLTVASINFYQSWSPDAADRKLAIDDQDATIAEVVMNDQGLSLLFQPIVEQFFPSGISSVTVLASRAVAENSTIGCSPPPLMMMCNPYEVASPVCGGHTGNFYEDDQIGRQVVLTEGTAGVPEAPGEFGLLALPDGTMNAADLGAAIASVTTPDCQGPEVALSPGAKTAAIVGGFNARFDASKGYANDPAPHVGAFPRDSNAGNPGVVVGDGEWKPASYLKPYKGHPFTVDQPPGGVHTPTRYQVYLWQIGVEYQMNGTATVFPARATSELPDIGGTWTTVNASGAVDIKPPTNIHKLPKTASSLTGDEEQWVKRRLTRAVVVDCTCLGIASAGTVQPNGRWVDLFITEKIKNPATGGTAIYAEFLSAAATGLNDAKDVVRNVTLID